MTTCMKNFKHRIEQVGVSKKVNMKAFSFRILLQKVAKGLKRCSLKNEIDQKKHKNDIEKSDY